MRLLFRQACQCKLKRDALPKPSFKFFTPPDMRDPIPEGTLDVGFTCALCGKPWVGFFDSGLKAEAKVPSAIRRIVRP